jgi:hypothetical protein
MYRDEKQIEINVVIKYEYDSELEKIKEIIKEITDLKKLKSLNIEEK